MNEDDNKAIADHLQKLTTEQYKILEEKFEKETKQNLSNTVKHINQSCDDGDCEVKQAVDEAEDNAFAIGFLLKELNNK